MRAFEALCPWLSEPLKTLEEAAKAAHLGHGWLISGARDIGKRNLAYVLAERLLNHEIGQAGLATATPRKLITGYDKLAEIGDLHPDLFRLRAAEDKRTIGVDQVREMTASLTLTSHIAGLKVLVVESAETMTTAAANALLKSLEEPTPNTYLFLLAERPGRLPATIRSRCQKLALQAPVYESVVAWLEQDGLAVNEAPPALVAGAPLAAARALISPEYLSIYNELYADINALSEGSGDPHSIADHWAKGDPDLALTCLVDSLQARIRKQLVPERWNPVTDSKAQLADNSVNGISTGRLFSGLKMAENLREQLGRGPNVGLALKALLVGLDQPKVSRVNK